MTPTIIIIDDDTSLRRVLEFNLQEAGYEVVTAASGEEGVRLFDEVSPALVITDMKMPGMDGMQVLKAIKERAPETLVIMITAFGTVDIAVEAMKAGAYDYITKPFNRDELRLTVAKALQFRGLAVENTRFKNELADRDDFRYMVGSSAAMEKVFQIVAKVADTEASVLITGESGTGKELVARSIHAGSSGKTGRSWRSTAPPSPATCWRASCSAMSRGPSPGPSGTRPAGSRWPTAGRSFSTRWGNSRWNCSPSCCGRSRKNGRAGGGKRRLKLDVRLVAATNLDIDRAIPTGASARISTTAWR